MLRFLFDHSPKGLERMSQFFRFNEISHQITRKISKPYKLYTQNLHNVRWISTILVGYYRVCAQEAYSCV
jgi:hypothetical protein